MANSSKSYTLGLALIIASIAGYMFFVSPTWTESENLISEKTATQANITNLQNELSNLQNLEKEMSNVSEVKQNTSLNAIPQNYDQDLLITSLIEKADEHKMNVNSISFGQGAQTDLGIYSANITASIQGDYQKLVGFLQSLENELQRKVIVRNISVELGGTTGALQEINFTLTLEVYFQNEN